MTVSLETKESKSLLQDYVEALEAYLGRPEESELHHAYELGRQAIINHVGLLELAALHHRAFQVLTSQTPIASAPEIAKAAAFFIESLSPFEMLLRGFQESNAHLLTMNETLRETKAAVNSLLVAYERSEHVSARFQQAALPQSLPEAAGFAFDACYRPGRDDLALGGDWYDASRLADGRIIISIGDVGGSGLNAAVVMVSIRQAVRGVAYVHPDPVMMLDAAGKALRAEHPDLYASAFVGVIDPIAMTLTYASAGHPPALLRMPDGTVQELEYRGVLLGIHTPIAHPPKVVKLRAGMLLLLYTDGLIEATGDILAGSADLRQVLADSVPTALNGLVGRIYDRLLNGWARDDVAILAVAVSPSPFQHGESTSHWSFEATDAEAAQHARTEFALQLRRAGAQNEDMYTAEIVFGELIGNVVRYAPGPVEVFADWSGPAPVLHVLDCGPGFFYAPHLPRDPLAENGRGLFIVSAITEDFNVTRIEERGSHARAVLSLSRSLLTAEESPQLDEEG
jgi:serine phosphatase RsbU (regulator of sigma subunit)/anti-sigma regulatory factor (Ser/Thr protein kinase)